MQDYYLKNIFVWVESFVRLYCDVLLLIDTQKKFAQNINKHGRKCKRADKPKPKEFSILIPEFFL